MGREGGRAFGLRTSLARLGLGVGSWWDRPTRRIIAEYGEPCQ